MSDDQQPTDEAANPETPVENPVDNDPGLPIPASEEQAEALPDPPGEHEKAEAVAQDPTVAGNTEIPGTGGGTRFFGAGVPPT